MCFTSADVSLVPATLPENRQTDVSATDEAVGFTVLGEVKPRSLKKVYIISHMFSICQELQCSLL